MFSPWIDLKYERPFPQRTHERAIGSTARRESPVLIQLHPSSTTRTVPGVRFGGPTILPRLDGPALPVSLSAASPRDRTSTPGGHDVVS